MKKLTKKTTVREVLQQVGTEFGRSFAPNIWINALMSNYIPHIENYPNLVKSNNKFLIEGSQYKMGKAVYPRWIITDTRFPDELQTIKKRQGLCIKIIGRTDNISSTSEHISEKSLDNYTNWDYIIDNNGTLKELVEKVREILTKEKII